MLSAIPVITLAMPKVVSTYDTPPGKAAGKVNGQAGKSKTAHLYLVEKDPTNPDWPIVSNGAWGKLTFKDTADGKFVFNGHKLEKKTAYTLIYYPDPWPGNGLMCIGTGTTNNGGNVGIRGTFDFDTIPIEADTNEGAKIWLVLTSDVDCTTGSSKMTAWNPTEYLFEYQLINPRTLPTTTTTTPP